eukprot:CAMPEP_0119065996 /NCGR_PEP_ID=MMETSP1178-20130426/8671_1 /TAXON_ID=33656 /ORGANISM="unid sp, Strain CCMP2000" /LENGTH=39 /DNA_ID= /DNA_START= /DNA_END= /DNA_ORIENTATION=
MGIGVLSHSCSSLATPATSTPDEASTSDALQMHGGVRVS